MYRAPSKRQQLVQRIFIYTLMSIGVVLLVTVLVLLMEGYRFNRETNTVQQGGLVQFNSRPGDAKVRIGRANLADSTPSKITVNPGEYEVRMQRNGYLPWTKDVVVKAGKVLWLNYAQLIPQTIERTVAAKFDKVNQMKASPNGKYLAVLTSPASSQLTIVQVDGQNVVQTKVDVESARTATTYKLQEWSHDSDRLLLTATKAGKTRWLLVERDAKEAGDVIDLTAKYGASLKEVRFDPRGSDRLVVRTDEGALRLLNISADAMSSIIVSQVESFSFYGDNRIVYVTKLSPTTKSLGYVSFDDTDAPRELKRIETTEPVKAAAASYFGDPYLAVAVGVSVEVYQLSSLPDSGSSQAITMETITNRTLPAAPSYLSVRSGGRFVIMQYAGGFATYDIELGKHTLTSMKGIGTQELRWLDKYHAYVTDGKQLQVMEFDGANQHAIAPLTTQFDAVQTDDGKYIYSLHKTDASTYELRRNQIILDS